MSPEFVQHFDSCIGCMACMTACPSGVEYNKLIEATRAQIERNYARSTGEKLYRRMLFATFTRPERLRLLRWPLLAYERTGLRALVRGSRILRFLPKKLQAMETLLPQLGAREVIPEVTPAVGERRRRAGLLLGCVQREFLPQLNAATVRVLSAEGCEIVAPAAQPCCGALMVHAGEEPPAMELARRTIDVFERAGVETIVTNAAGCGSNVKEYGHLLRDDPMYAGRANAFSKKCKDVSEVLADLVPRTRLRGLPLARRNGRIRVAFHDSCHLQHAQGVREEPLALLARIPGVELVEIPEAAICCGSAGIYNLTQPAAANSLGDRKATLISELNVDVVATGNPGCMLQLQASLDRTGKKIRVMHTVELLDAAME